MESHKVIRKMDLEFMFGPLVIAMKDILQMTREQGRESIPGYQEMYTMVIGQKIKEQEKY